MSFILDALKKSEERRQQSGDASQVRRRVMSYQNSGRRQWGWWLLLLIPLAAAVGWLLRGGHEALTTPNPIAPAAVMKPVVDTPAADVAATLPHDSGESLPSATPVQQEQIPLGQMEKPEIAPAPVPKAFGQGMPAPVPLPKKTPTAEAVSQQDRSQQGSPADDADKAVAIADKLSETRLPLYRELSRELRDRLPHLTMSMHYYAKEPRRRLVRINERLLHEGDRLDEELKLVEVTPTGAVFDYLGRLFELRGQSGP